MDTIVFKAVPIMRNSLPENSPFTNEDVTVTLSSHSKSLCIQLGKWTEDGTLFNNEIAITINSAIAAKILELIAEQPMIAGMRAEDYQNEQILKGVFDEQTIADAYTWAEGKAQEESGLNLATAQEQVRIGQLVIEYLKEQFIKRNKRP